MKSKLYFYIVRTTTVVIVLSRALAADISPKPSNRVSSNEIDRNDIQDVSDSSASPSSYALHHDHHSPSPFIKNEYTSVQQQRPPLMGSARRQFNEKESYKVEKVNKPEDGKNFASYILTAGGKEKIYEEDMGHSYKPHYSETPYYSKYSENEKMPGKKFMEKSFKKYRYAYSNRRGGHTSMYSGSPKDEFDGLSGFRNTEFRLHSEIPKTRNNNGLAAEAQTHLYASHPPFVYFNEKTDIYGLKATPWKQLGPNIEISTSAENPTPFQRPMEASKEARKKMKTKRVKSVPKNVRTGYMTGQQQQHALYVANNLQNLKPLKSGVFDHNNVLKQSDKFEITDAMITEAEREEALRNSKAQQKVRIKQELPKDQSFNLQTPEPAGSQYYSQPHGIQFPIVAAPFEAPSPVHGKFGIHGSFSPPIGTYSKGFIRHIEIENGPSGGKKMVPALIIPLSPEQLNGAYFNPEPATLLHVNQPDVLNPKPKAAHTSHPVHPFPYDIVTPRYHQNEVINTIVPVENYHFQQQYPAYQYAGQPLDDNFNSYVNYQNQHVYSRVPFNYNPSTTATTPFSPEAGKAAPVAYSTQTIAFHNAAVAAVPPVAAAAPVTPDTRPSRQNSPYSVAIQPKKQNVAVTEQTEAEPKMGNDYTDDSEEKYLSPSEGSYFTTITSTKNDRDGVQSFQKSDTRRN